MCLYIPVSGTSALKPTLAEHDVPCYKFLNFKEGQLTSYFLKFPYEIGKCYTTEEDFSNIAVGGSYYYQGEDMGGAPNYVSQSIVIDEIINDD